MVLFRRLARDWRRAAATGLSVLLAVTAFVVLTGSAQQSRLEVTATVDANFRSSYDILVRPKGSKTPIEASTGRVRPNYLSGSYGGITTAQSDTVAKIQGVEISAPIAMVGQVFQAVDVPVDITDLVGDSGPALVRFSSSETSMRGLAKTTGPAGYVYVGDGVKLDLNSDDTPVLEKQGPRTVAVCQDLRRGTQVGSPFDRQNTWDPTCYDRSTGRSGMSWPQKPGEYLATVRMSFPVTIAAIDPVAEAKLTGLDQAVVTGRYLDADDAAATVENQLSVPMLASSRSLVDQVDTVTVDKLDNVAVASLRKGLSREAARTMVEAAGEVSSRSVTITASQAHTAWLDGRDRGPGQRGVIYPLALFAPTPVTYDQSPGGPLRPRPVKVEPTVWLSTVFVNVPFVSAPAAATDTGYRDIAAAPAVGGNDADFTPVFRTYGTFDPSKVRAFSELSKLPLETYQPPVVTGADDATRSLLKGQTLAPDANPSGYVQNPPLLLTTLKALPTLMSSRAFDWPVESRTPTAPISAVRVRVAGVTGSDPASRERIRLTAEKIVAATGLDVDITVGSSPRPTPVQLPATAHGAPPLLVTENWVQKGVAATITIAVDRKSLTLFILILVTTALAVSISANASVRSRRTELGVLACLGWRPGLLTRDVLGQLLVIGAVAGVLGALVAVPVGAAFGAQVPLARAALAVPAAIVLTLLAGLVPALRAARATPADAVRPAVTDKARFRVRLRGPASMALNYVARTPARAFTGAIALAMGVAALTALTGIAVAFQGSVVGTLLGDAVSVQVRGADLVAAAVMTVIGLGCLLDILYLDLREQGARYASLQASGWRDTTLTRLIVGQAALIGALGAVLGAGLGLAAVAALTPLTAQVVLVGALIAGAGIGLTCLLALLPARRLRTLPTAQLLSQE